MRGNYFLSVWATNRPGRCVVRAHNASAQPALLSDQSEANG
jgi:hypothetical protein